jgi:FdhD protein
VSPIAPVRARHYDGESDRERDEVLAVEEPLELRIHGVPIAVVMRTPGHDEELAMGFLVTERIVTGAGEVVSIRHCTEIPSPEAEDNVVQIRLSPGIEPPLERLRRNLYASSSCGVCGKATIASALGCAPPIESEVRFDPRTIQSIPERLRAAQAAFEATGGLHAAALFDGEGELLVVREDVGRHNAVDKIVGASEHAGIDRSRLGLFVSGRVSFELVQKAAAARIAVIAGISAPTSLAVAAGRELGVTVVGFVRGASMNVYSEPSRIAPEPSRVASAP